MDDSFAKGLRLIEALAASDSPVGLSELSRQCSLVKSHVHKFLRTLVERGYVEQKVERGPYQLTLKLWQIGAQTIARADLPSAAREPIRLLSDLTRETIQLAVFDDGDAVYIYNVDGTMHVRTHTDVGRRRPAHCVAAGKVLLAFLPETAMEAVSKKLKKFTDSTIINTKLLRAELLEIRRLGYAVNRGEWTPMVRGLAAPIFDARGQIIAAINLSAPAERLTATHVKNLAPHVMETAAAISKSLGYLKATGV